MEEKSFQLGDQVTWESQAGGHSKIKVGTIVEVVYIGNRPDEKRFPHLYRSNGVGYFGRAMISYVVMVGRIPYWPLVSKLSAYVNPMTKEEVKNVLMSTQYDPQVELAAQKISKDEDDCEVV